MEIVRLILDYIKVLIWPTVLACIIIRYRHYLDRLLRRLGEADEYTFESSGVTATAKFRRDMQSMSQQVPDDQAATKQMLTDKVKELTRIQFQELCDIFHSRSLADRKRAAVAIEALSRELSVDDILGFSRSHRMGERVGAAISLRVHLQDDPSLKDDKGIMSAISDGLNDSHSRVRYRYIEVLQTNIELVNMFREHLDDIAGTDSNPEVRRIAEKALRT